MVVLILILLGLCLGSFANALVWRVYQQEFASKNKINSAKYAILKGRSMCVNCMHTLAWYDLLPVVSWLALRAKCRYCHKPISWQYPVVELTTAGLFVASYLHWPTVFISNGDFAVFGLWLILLTGFIALAVFDIRWMILPNRIVFPLQSIATVYALSRFAQSGSEWSVLGGALAGVLCSAGVFYMLFQVSGGKWIGGGDVKLSVVLGLVLGSGVNALLMLFIASLLGTLVGLPMIVRGKAKARTKLPFGPFLMTATVIVVIFGAQILDWYTRQFLSF